MNIVEKNYTNIAPSRLYLEPEGHFLWCCCTF